MGISACIITKNEEWIISKTLEAIATIADEIIVVDSESTDATVEIAQSYGAKVFIEPFMGDGPQKNSAISKCTGQWILYLDADEVVTPELKEQLLQISQLDYEQARDVYYIRFKNFSLGKRLCYGNFKSFYKVRFFKRGMGFFSDKRLHSEFQLAPQAKSTYLKSSIHHHTTRNMSHLLQKVNFYTTEKAIVNSKLGKHPGIAKSILSSTFTFFRCYILKLGFLDGFHGFLQAAVSASYTLITNLKTRELNNKHIKV